jgi:hypothetical protein
MQHDGERLEERSIGQRVARQLTSPPDSGSLPNHPVVRLLTRSANEFVAQRVLVELLVFNHLRLLEQLESRGMRKESEALVESGVDAKQAVGPRSSDEVTTATAGSRVRQNPDEVGTELEKEATRLTQRNMLLRRSIYTIDGLSFGLGAAFLAGGAPPMPWAATAGITVLAVGMHKRDSTTSRLLTELSSTTRRIGRAVRRDETVKGQLEEALGAVALDVGEVEPRFLDSEEIADVVSALGTMASDDAQRQIDAAETGKLVEVPDNSDGLRVSVRRVGP